MTRHESPADDGVRIRLLEPHEGARVGEAIRIAYGDSYDASWVYDAAEVGRRIAEGRFVSCVAETADGELLGHGGLTLTGRDDPVAESGQAVTAPEARGHHVFQRIKTHLAAWATQAGLCGLYSEVTTAHPWSEQANAALGSVEVGFLLGWIPATVRNDAGDSGDTRGRTSAALFYLKTNDGHRRPVYAPARHRAVVDELVRTAGLRGVVTDAGDAAGALVGVTELRTTVRDDHNIAIVSVQHAGAEVAEAVAAERARLFGGGIDVCYVDLDLNQATTEAAGDALDDIGVTFAGVFPNLHTDDDVLRLQSLNGWRISPDEVATVSDHGRRLLEYVCEDAARHGA